MKMAQGETLETTISQQEGDRVELVYYTDPLCCWSWAMEAPLQRLLEEDRGRMSIRYCMGGMIPDWTSYNDPVNAVTKPIQMGPVCMEVRHLTGVAIDDRIWVLDPPASSYPACIAVKTAGLQSKQAEVEYLQLLREAVMTKGKNISRNAVLFELAEQVETEFNFEQFRGDLLTGPGKAAFLEDLKEVRTEQIQRFPTLALRHKGKGLIITGYKPYEVLQAALKKIRE
jgi:putative protein-disulfide isomerase